MSTATLPRARHAAGAVPATGSAVYLGWVTHRRRSPVEHRFRYPTAMLLLDLDELPDAERRAQAMLSAYLAGDDQQLVALADGAITVKGAGGSLTRALSPLVNVKNDAGTLRLGRDAVGVGQEDLRLRVVVQIGDVRVRRLEVRQLVKLRPVGPVRLVAEDDLELPVAVEVGRGRRDAPVLRVPLGRVGRVAEQQVALVVVHLPAEQDLRGAVARSEERV